MSEPPKGPKSSFAVSKVMPTGGAKPDDKKSAAEVDKKDEDRKATKGEAEAKEAPKPGGVAKRVMSFQVGSKPK